MTLCQRGKKMVRTVALSASVLLIASAAFAAGTPKYVFYFIGDGMGPAQRQSAQYFYKIETKNPEAKLLMNSFPTSALITTYSDNTMITDSAAGGTALATGFKTTNGAVSKLPDGTNIKTIAEAARDDFRAYHPKKGDKVLAPLAYSALGMEIDRRFSTQVENPMPALSELTAKGIEVLAAQEKPFFMMVEGGRIDYAAHCNDATGTIYDTLALDAAIAEAYEFYKQHPEETLIVVAADHETGGMAMGISLDSKGYFLNLNELLKVKASVEDTLAYVYPKMIKDFPKVAKRQQAYLDYVAEYFGLTDLNTRELKQLLSAMTIEDRNQTLKSAQQTTYGYAYTPTMIAVAHLVSERARISWTSYVHTSSVIALSAIGAQADTFGGFKDNTEIPRTMATAMGVKLSSFEAVPSKALLGKTFGPNKKYSEIPYGHTENVAGKN